MNHQDAETQSDAFFGSFLCGVHPFVYVRFVYASQRLASAAPGLIFTTMIILLCFESL